MYFDTSDKAKFLAGELQGLRQIEASTAHIARLSGAAWSRAEADLSGHARAECEQTEARAYAKRERLRVAHREAMAARDERAAFEGDFEDGDTDMDEYGYAA